MRMPFRPNRVAIAVAGATLALAAPLAHGAAFALQENNASGLGNAYAGGAAVAEDASTVWSNPAGMSRLKQREAVQAIHFIIPSNKFSDDGWIGRYHGIKSQVKTINVQPTIAWKVNDQFSVGLGIDFQWIDARLTSDANYSGAIAQGAAQAVAAGQLPAAAVPGILAATGGLDSRVTVKGDDTAWGWNIGALYEMNPNTRIGAHYRSGFKYTVRGDVDFNHPTLPALPPALAPVVNTIANGVNRALFNGDVHAKIELPPIVNVSAFHRLNDRWDVMADLQWTGWSTLKDLTFVRNEGPVLASTPENFDDVWRFSVGANYRVNDRWMLRGGLAFDESPVNDTDRTPRLPDSDRTWISFGAQYKHSQNLTIDGGFTYIFIDDSTINTNAGSTAQYGLLRGNYDSNVVIVSIQAALRF